ncbi:hypothetical protein GQ457_12G000110 [Hibiscus cannabinus]
MIKQYCWKLFVFFRIYARNDQPGRIKCSSIVEIFSYILKGRVYQREGRIKVNIKDLKPKRIKDCLECKINQRTQPSRVLCTSKPNKLFGLRHKPITLQDALPRSESAEKICPGRTRCLLSRHPLCHPAQTDYRSP